MGERETISCTMKTLEDRTDLMSLSMCVDALRRLMEIRSELTQIASTETLERARLPYPFELLTSGTERVRAFLGTMPVSVIPA